jgi:hypothetical protein
MKAFQLRSRAVRAASQDLMRRLREERAAMSRHARPTSAAEKPAAPKPEPAAPIVAAVSDIKPSRKILASAPVESPKTVAPAKRAARPRKPKVERAPAMTAPEPAAADVPPAPKASKKPAGKPRAKKPVPAPVQALQQALAETFTAAEAVVSAATAHAQQSVSSVPTLGPGMVWRLNQLGVATLGDLAAQDSDALKRQLGRLGRMVNVDQWIAYAKGA